MQLPRSLFLLLVLLAGTVIACGDDDPAGDATSDAAGDLSGDTNDQADQGRGTCNSTTNVECIEIRRGESVLHRWLVDYDTLQYDDEGTMRTVVRLTDLIDAEVAEDPAAWRYQVFGTDGYTFGGYATWANMQAGYIELTSRRVVFDPSQELPRSFRVKDAYLIVLSPG